MSTEWEEDMCRNRVHLLIDLVHKGVLLLNHAYLHLATEVLPRTLGYLLNVGF